MTPCVSYRDVVASGGAHTICDQNQEAYREGNGGRREDTDLGCLEQEHRRGLQ